MQLRHLSRRSINLLKPRAFFWHNCDILRKHVHYKSLELLDILSIPAIFRRPLVIHISKEVAVLEIAFKILGVSEVLRWYQPTLHERDPCSRFQKAVPCVTEPVIGRAFLELADAVVLAAKSNEICHRRFVAALDVSTEKLASL